MNCLLITPPLVQSNAPYPATAYLTGFLRDRGETATQIDMSIELLCQIFSRETVLRISEEIGSRNSCSAKAIDFLQQRDEYIRAVDPAIRYLQNRDPSLAHRIACTDFLPQGSRFSVIEEIDKSLEGGFDAMFGMLGIADKAAFLASLFVDDLCDLIADSIDEDFGLARYAEKLGLALTDFSLMEDRLNASPTMIDTMIDSLTETHFVQIQPEIVLITVPFPGAFYGALRVGKKIKELSPSTKIVLGGGYISTELRELSDPRIFAYCDYVVLDDGQTAIESILKQQSNPDQPLLRTFVEEQGIVVFKNSSELFDLPFKQWPNPTFDGLPNHLYFGLTEMANPMHRLWSSYRWNKLMLAHGCYWHKCSFCDTSLDYVAKFNPGEASRIVDIMEQIIGETNQSGFHFVDEAAPPAMLGRMADEINRRRLGLTWWGNIRFEKIFDTNLVSRLASSGCIGVTGGLEGVTPKMLTILNKGILLPDAIRSLATFAESGIMVHSYLMYGIPGQTTQDIVDACEIVRQLFEIGVLHSAYWHRFSATEHSPIGMNPQQFGITLNRPESSFVRNDVPFTELAPKANYDVLGKGLKASLYNFMYGLALDQPVQKWFEIPVPKPTIKRDFVEKILGE